MEIIIKISDGEISSAHGLVESTLETHIAANDHLVWEARVLQEFLAADFDAPDWPFELQGGFRLVEELERAEVLFLVYSDSNCAG